MKNLNLKPINVRILEDTTQYEVYKNKYSQHFYTYADSFGKTFGNHLDDDGTFEGAYNAREIITKKQLENYYDLMREDEERFNKKFGKFNIKLSMECCESTHEIEIDPAPAGYSEGNGAFFSIDKLIMMLNTVFRSMRFFKENDEIPE